MYYIVPIYCIDCVEIYNVHMFLSINVVGKMMEYVFNLNLYTIPCLTVSGTIFLPSRAIVRGRFVQSGDGVREPLSGSKFVPVLSIGIRT
jgi:hypothetical protein